MAVIPLQSPRSSGVQQSEQWMAIALILPPQQVLYCFKLRWISGAVLDWGNDGNGEPYAAHRHRQM